MNLLVFLLGFTVVFKSADTYVLIKVQEQDVTDSKVDALVHKSVPSDRVQKFADSAIRKSWTTETHKNPFEVQNKIIESEDETYISNEIQDQPLHETESAKQTKQKSIHRNKSKRDRIMFKPEKVQLQGGRSAPVYTLRSENIVATIQNMLSSATFRNYLDKLTEKAAFVYRAVENKVRQDPIARALLGNDN